MNDIVAVVVSPRTGSVAALRWGAQEATRRHADLFAVSVWRGPHPPMTSGARMPAVSYDPDSTLAQEIEDLEEHAHKILGPDQAITCRVVHGINQEVIDKVSRRASLLVMEAPRNAEEFARLNGRRWFHQLLQRVHCAVVVIPPALQTEVVRYSGIRPAQRAKPMQRQG
jgi:hypothetical protein